MRTVKRLYYSVLINVRELLNPILGGIRRRRDNICKPFTIISNNCWAGHVYRYYNLPYDSPTIGLYFFSEEYVKFIADLSRYIKADLHFISAESSKYYNIIHSLNQDSAPIGVLDDIEIVFLHYKSEDEALQKWNRRKARIHWNNIFYKMTEQNMCTTDHLAQFDALPSDNPKLLFTSKDYGLESQIIVNNFVAPGLVYNDTTYFKKYVSLGKWLNNKQFKRH